MIMNLIPKIAEMLGVELNEVFKIKANGEILECNYRISERGIEHTVFTTDDWCQAGRMLEALLNGEAEIVKLPFEPKLGEKYFYVSTTHPLSVEPAEWSAGDYVIELAFKYCGNVFRTKAEAEVHKYEIYEKLTGKKWEEK